MPAEFATDPTILSASTTVTFADGRVYADAEMTYFATHAEQVVTLRLRQDDREIFSDVARSARSDFFPFKRDLFTPASFAVSNDCGLAAHGSTAHSAWHAFLVSGWKFMSWGNTTRPSGDDDTQEPCAGDPPPDSGPGGSKRPGGSYDTGCLSCQQWFWVENYRIVDEWWECTPIDAGRCEFLES